MHKIISPSKFLFKTDCYKSIYNRLPLRFPIDTVNWNTQKWVPDAKFWEKWWLEEQNMAKGGIESKEWKLRLLKSIKLALSVCGINNILIVSKNCGWTPNSYSTKNVRIVKHCRLTCYEPFILSLSLMTGATELKNIEWNYPVALDKLMANTVYMMCSFSLSFDWSREFQSRHSLPM